jgi:hypothetical protein
LSFQIRQQAGSYRCCFVVSDSPASRLLQALLCHFRFASKPATGVALPFHTGQQQQGICYAENCNVLLKSPIGACPRAAIAVAELTVYLSVCRTSAAVGVTQPVITP